MSAHSSAYPKDISSSASSAVAELLCKHMPYFNPFDDPKFTTEKFKVDLSASREKKYIINKSSCLDYFWGIL